MHSGLGLRPLRQCASFSCIAGGKLSKARFAMVAKRPASSTSAAVKSAPGRRASSTSAAVKSVLRRPSSSTSAATRKLPSIKRPASAISKFKPRKTIRRPSSAILKFKVDRTDPNFVLGHRILDQAGTLQVTTIMENVIKLGKVLRVFSMCTGANMMTIQARLLLEGLCEDNSGVRVGEVDDIGTCEINDKKAAFGDFVAQTVGSGPDGDGEHCSHKDILKLAEGDAHCRVHDGKCGLADQRFKRTPLITACGFSCENFSKQFNSKGGVTRDEIMDGVFSARKGTSGQTGLAMLDTIGETRSRFLLYENSPELLANVNRDEYAAFETEAYRKGYANFAKVFSLAKYGPQNGRTRTVGGDVRVRYHRAGARGSAESLR